MKHRRPGAALALAATVLFVACRRGEPSEDVTPSGDWGRYGDKVRWIDQVVDGDTAVLDDGTQVRYIGIDAPEGGLRQCGAEQATALNRRLVEGRPVTLRLDRADTRDRFGRLLAYLEVEDRIVNVDLVASGWACAFPLGRTRRYRAEIAAAEAAARAARRGVWTGCPTVPRGCPPAE
ncbi:MAG: thermonuclease family protein [Gemmatimonadota bacterium]